MRDDDTATAIKETVETRRYFLMTNIRLMLDKFKIDANFNPSPLLQRSYYFTVSDWLVGAACFCNGQASECDAQVRKQLQLYSVHLKHSSLFRT